MNYKLNRIICSAAIVSTLMPLTACEKKAEDITLSRNNEIAHLINPVDWTNTPDYVNLELKDNYIIMDINTFYRLLNNNESSFIINVDGNKIELDKKELKEKVDQEFYEYNTPSLKDYIKVTITIIEGTVIFIIGNKIISSIEKTKQKIKKLS